jgi:hypothetical protein
VIEEGRMKKEEQGYPSSTTMIKDEEERQDNPPFP